MLTALEEFAYPKIHFYALIDTNYRYSDAVKLPHF